jgi:hypothetical protein
MVVINIVIERANLVIVKVLQIAHLTLKSCVVRLSPNYLLL